MNLQLTVIYGDRSDVHGWEGTAALASIQADIYYFTALVTALPFAGGQRLSYLHVVDAGEAVEDAQALLPMRGSSAAEDGHHLGEELYR